MKKRIEPIKEPEPSDSVADVAHVMLDKINEIVDHLNAQS